MKTYTLSNSYHKTSVNFRMAEEDVEDYGAGDPWLAIQVLAEFEASEGPSAYYGPQRRREARVRRVLCGSSYCSCGVVR